MQRPRAIPLSKLKIDLELFRQLFHRPHATMAAQQGSKRSRQSETAAKQVSRARSGECERASELNFLRVLQPTSKRWKGAQQHDAQETDPAAQEHAIKAYMASPARTEVAIVR